MSDRPLAALAAGVAAEAVATAETRRSRVTPLAPSPPPACVCNGWRVKFALDDTGPVARATAWACVCTAACPCEQGWWFSTDAAGYRTTARCGDCGLAHDRAERWRRAEIPGRYWDAWLDAVDEKPREATSPKAMRYRLGRWAESWSPGARGLFIFGPKGVGKTHAAIGAMRWILFHRVNAENRPHTMRYVDLTALWEALKAEMSSGGPPVLRDRLIGPSLLVLDEVGQARNSQWQVEQLSDIVGRRYNAKRTTVFLSNHHPGDVTDKLDAAIGHAGQRLVDRMAEMSSLIEVTGESRRTWTPYDPD